MCKTEKSIGEILTRQFPIMMAIVNDPRTTQEEKLKAALDYTEILKDLEKVLVKQVVDFVPTLVQYNEVSLKFNERYNNGILRDYGCIVDNDTGIR